MVVKIKKSLLGFILSEYDDSFDPWYRDYLPSLHSRKDTTQGMVIIDISKQAYTWLVSVIRDDSHGHGRLLDTYEECTAQEKRAITKFIKEAREFLSIL